MEGCCIHSIGTSVDEDGCCTSCGEDLNYIAEQQEQINQLQAEKEKLLELVQAVYRKHHLSDDTFGWGELGDMLCDGLCEIMGDKKFQEWVSSKSKP